MAEKQLSIRIDGKDNLSPIFKKIGAEATSASKEIQTGSQQASKSLDTVGKSAGTTSEKLRAMEGAGRTLGTGLAAISASFALYSRSLVENQQAVATLERTYGEAAGVLEQFAEQVQRTTVYSSEQAVAAENAFGTLVRNYGLSVDQVQQLVQISTDLAATSGLTLEDTAMRVQAAIRGEAESAEALGLTLNQQAIDRNNLTLTMTAQEAAQYRLNALIEQSAFAQGAAAEKAATTAGKVQQLANQVDDAGRSFVEMTGPIGQAVGGMSNFSLQAGLAAGGIVQLARGAQQASSVVGGFSTVLGGAGLAAAAVAAYYGAQTLARHFDDEFPAALHAAQGATETLDEAISRMTVSLGDAALALRFTNINTGLDQTLADLDRIDFLRQQINTIPQGGRADADTIKAYEAELAALEAKYGDLTETSNEAKAAQADLAVILNHASAGAELAQKRALELSEQYNTGQISLAEYAWQLNWISENFSAYDQQALQAQVSTQNLNRRFEEGTVFASQYAEAVNIAALAHAQANSTTLALLATIGDLSAAQQGIKIDIDRTSVGLGSYTAQQERQQQAASDAAATNKGEYADSLQTISTQLRTGTSDAVAFGNALAAQRQAAADFAAQLTDAAKAVGLLDSSAEQLIAQGFQSPTLNLAVNTSGAVDAVNAVFGAIVEGTNKIGQQSQGIADWIGGLTTAAEGQVSDLQALYIKDQISRTTYNRAMEASGSILKDNADIQEDLLRIQAKQAPVIADLVHQEAAYIDSLADADTQTQLVALGYMDTAESAKAMALAQLAANAAMSGFTGPAASVIASAAEADPVLRAMLESMGLITEHEDGTFSVNIEGADTVQSSIDDLATAINNLAREIRILVGEEGAADTQKAIERVTGAANDVPKGITAHIDVVDNASGTIGEVARQLKALDNATARTFLETYQTTFVNTQYNTTPTPGHAALLGATIMEYASGGTVMADIPRYAIGGTHALVGEVGPELVWLPNGSQVTNAVATRSRLDSESKGRDRWAGVNFFGPVTLAPSSTDVEAAIRQEAMGGARR